jgi:hypothetical protein
VWELASRQLPFAGLHHGEIIHKVVTQDLRPSPWPAQAAALPPGYVALAESCWARRVSDRPSMAQVLQALLEMLAAALQSSSSNRVTRDVSCALHQRLGWCSLAQVLQALLDMLAMQSSSRGTSGVSCASLVV